MAGVERERKREERGKRRGTGERGKLAPATRTPLCLFLRPQIPVDRARVNYSLYAYKGKKIQDEVTVNKEKMFSWQNL